VPAVNIGAYDNDGVGFGGGNLGMPDYQVSIGFSEGDDPLRARALVRRVVAILGKRWHVETRLGAAKMNECPAISKTPRLDPSTER
jgi:hypothetical protein